jgi:hypothetical protein
MIGYNIYIYIERERERDYIVCLLHISAILVAILSEAYYKGYVIKHFETIHKRNLLRF